MVGVYVGYTDEGVVHGGTHVDGVEGDAEVYECVSVGGVYVLLGEV